MREWRSFDKDCVVRPYPSDVQVDLLLRDGKHILLAVKSSMSRADMDELFRVGRLYEKETGTKPEVAALTPAATPAALDAAKRSAIRVFTPP